MTDAEALAEAIRRTGHARYADLVDPAHPDYQPAYWTHIRRAAGVNPEVNSPPPTPSVVPLSVSLRAVQLGYRRCLYSAHEGCGCTGTHCYRLGRVVGLNDCITCLKGA